MNGAAKDSGSTVKKLTIQWFTGHEHRSTDPMEAVLSHPKMKAFDLRNIVVLTDHPFGEYTGQVGFVGPESELLALQEEFGEGDEVLTEVNS